MSPANKKVFLHLSDIHFVKDFSGESNYDIDAALRHALEQDAQKMLESVGDVDGILISGDIAFGGKVKEYETARSWLKKLAEILRCDPGFVWSVPGNHDIDQSVQKDIPTLFDTYEALRKSDKLDEELRERLENLITGPLMFQPLKNYNEQFGAQFDCPTTSHKPWWEDELSLSDGYVLRLRGLNSAIISSKRDRRDTAKLILGSAQTSYRPEAHIVYLTLCHHPPDWLVDGDDSHEAMAAHSHLQLLGHKHAHKHEKINNTVRLYSGAVHPVRTEKNWDPRYYFLQLKIERDGDSTELVVNLYPRVWSKTERLFVRDAGNFAGLYLTERLKLSKLPTTPPTKVSTVETQVRSVEKISEMTFSRKKFSYRFMTLPYHAQISIIKKFGLATDSEIESIPDVDLFTSCFQRARDKNVLEGVWDAIENEEKKTEG